MNKTIEYPVTKGLSVLITVEQNPLGLNPASLFRMAARINKKRSFLFVSPVLGKHLPVNPSIPLMIGRVLALIYGNQLEGHQQRLKDVLNDPEKQRDLQFDQEGLPLVEWARPLTVIGFCETATALGQAFFESFSSPVKYIHTTREDIVALVPVVSFEEEHSHATAHRVYAEDPVFFSDDSEVVLVDDEVTTGKTNLNIIRDLVRAYPHKKQFTIVSILDWRNEKNQQAYAQLEQELGVQVRAISLLNR